VGQETDIVSKECYFVGPLFRCTADPKNGEFPGYVQAIERLMESRFIPMMRPIVDV